MTPLTIAESRAGRTAGRPARHWDAPRVVRAVAGLLGLAIVRGIVDAHRGRVSVVNAGEGCRFEVRLPALAPASDVERAVGEQPGSRPAALLISGL